MQRLIICLLVCIQGGLFSQSVFAFTFKDNVKEYGIALLVDGKCVDAAAKANRQIAGELVGLPNVLNNFNVTLYRFALTEENMKKIYLTMQDLKVKPIELNFNTLYDSDDRSIDWGVDQNQSLLDLHREIVNMAAPYIKRPLKSMQDKYNSLSLDQRRQIDKFGTLDVLSLYKPHMTLFYQYPANNKLSAIPKLVHVSPVKCLATKIAIGEIDYNGNLKNILHVVNMSSK